ncbi:hypothetical protein [Rhizobium straminoryzae]|uniref:Uncharacterized protein n=1 Tax=Rhizobium straminoryzae TaxID=1387186 RepID=A0A549TAI6_9HYPH|nr:hypothetical protein [Rhizobium straminoryzae]TRL38892.1 hypothetical protein FNA46_11170 [Rhizobium straminoryzae]
MRTIDQTAETPSSSPASLTRRTGLAGLRWIASIAYRLFGNRHGPNHAADLTAHGLRDIGFEDHGLPPCDALDRAARQDARVSEARRVALMFTMGMGGR